MNKNILRLLTLLLVTVMLLCACHQQTTSEPATRPTTEESITAPPESDTGESDSDIPHFSEMEYTRPDPEALLNSLDTCAKLAENPYNEDALIEELVNYLTLQSNYLTNSSLADIHYNLDLSDSYWEAEYNYCSENSVAIQAKEDTLLHTLAASSHRAALEGILGEGFFDQYDGESLWTEEFTALMDQEMALWTEYYAIYEEAIAPGYIDETGFNKLAELYLQMVKLRHQIAEAAGYEDYSTYSYELEHLRDFSPEEAQIYIDEIAKELAPLYNELTADSWFVLDLYDTQSKRATYQYVQTMATNAGGDIADCFQLMEKHGLYDLTMSDNKMDISFERFLPDYMVPFVFINPYGMNHDSLTFAHEFGHFCNDYLSGGATAGMSMDVAEIFSQGMEYMSLCYVESDLEKLQMYSSLCVYVEQAMYADFELAVYSIPEEELSVDALREAYADSLQKFGVDDSIHTDTDFVAIPHFFVAPHYVISYVVSNDAALQLYQMELLNPGSGLACYTENLDTTEIQLLSFLEQANLASPFTEGRITDVKETFESVLK